MRPFLAILGPTASGKSAFAHELAAQWDAEIISCDSMQVYRGLTVGVAKPTPEERARFHYHLVDIRELHEPWNANLHALAARQILATARNTGRRVILAGGTGLYAKTVIYGLDLEPSDKPLAAALEDDWRKNGPGGLTDELRAFDASLAERVAGNPRRLLRTIEILRLTGDAPRWWRNTRQPETAAPEWRQIVLMPEPAHHRQLIEERTRAMLRAGWIEEARDLYAAGLAQAPTARQALGYATIRDYLDGRLASLEALEHALVAQTWQYARRQRTWFRHQHPGAQMVPVEPGAAGRQRLDQLLAACGRR
ncbi:MAG: tRNA (adenosine(37)-N6)-dimethylallyltransferase MiaA [Lentisphaeria bacterium]